MSGGAAAPHENAFELLGLELEATEAQIRTAYRKRSLQLHPDKVRDVPPDVAADRFHRLTLAYEELMSTSKHAELIQKLQQERDRQARRSVYDDRRRAMAADLEQREEQDRRAKLEREQRRQERERLISVLREEGRALRIAQHEALLSVWQARASASAAAAAPAPPAPPTTVLLRFPTEQAPELLGAPTTSDENVLSTPLAGALRDAYGDVIDMHVKRSHKKRREVTVQVRFATASSAAQAVADGEHLHCTHPLLQDCWLGWPKDGQELPLAAHATDFDVDYEARTLARLRAAATLA